MKSSVKITFYPQNITLSVPVGSSLKEIAAQHSILIDFACGGQGQCGKCKVEIKNGLTTPNQVEKKLLSKEELKNNIRLACRTRVKQNMVIITSGQGSVAQKNTISFIPSSLDQFHPAVKKSAPGCYITEQAANYGLALDIGTTTVAGSLIDLTNGAEIAAAAETNTQSVYGSDVISRINYAVTQKDGLAELQQKIIAVINKISSQLIQKTSIKPAKINDVAVVGNTVMQHLLLGVKVDTLAVLPFEPAYQGAVNTKASELKINVNPDANTYIFPHIAGFVGGDAVGLILALDLHRQSKINLAIDIGTNGEIVLGSKKGLVATSTAAGPAFEGVRINCGMRAVSGAIESVRLTERKIIFKTIADTPPAGICGSGLIDILAELLKLEIINETGLMRSKDELSSPKKLPAYLLQSLISNGQSRSYRGRPPAFWFFRNKNRILKITQSDIRELQLAKGAIAAGITLLRKEAGVATGDLERIFIAGTFGNYLDKKNAQAIGLIPDISLERVVFVGNAALTGAKLALISREARADAEKIARTTGCLNLSQHKMFQDEFAEAMYFKPRPPRCPSGSGTRSKPRNTKS